MYVEYGVGREAVGTHPEGKVWPIMPIGVPLETDKGLKFIKTMDWRQEAPMYRGFKESRRILKAD